jgi:hypothetical protein
MSTKNIFVLYTLSFYAYSFLNAHLHHSSKIKSHRKSQNSRNHGFSLFFSGWWRILIRIRTNKLRIRIQKAQKHTSPTDPDQEHWFYASNKCIEPQNNSIRVRCFHWNNDITKWNRMELSTGKYWFQFKENYCKYLMWISKKFNLIEVKNLAPRKLRPGHELGKRA